MVYADMTKDEWLRFLKIRDDEVPELIVVEGDYAFAKRIEERSKELTEVQPRWWPQGVAGSWKGMRVWYTCIYGAPMGLDAPFLASRLGVPHVVLIGSCGALRQELQLGDVVIAASASNEGVAVPGLSRRANATPSKPLVSSLIALCRESRLTWHRGPLVSFHNIVLETRRQVQRWMRAGFLAVDMEAAPILIAARRWKLHAAVLLAVVDNLATGRKVTDAYSDAERDAYYSTERAIFRIACEAVHRLHSKP